MLLSSPALGSVRLCELGICDREIDRRVEQWPPPSIEMKTDGEGAPQLKFIVMKSISQPSGQQQQISLPATNLESIEADHCYTALQWEQSRAVEEVPFLDGLQYNEEPSQQRQQPSPINNSMGSPPPTARKPHQVKVKLPPQLKLKRLPTNMKKKRLPPKLGKKILQQQGRWKRGAAARRGHPARRQPPQDTTSTSTSSGVTRCICALSHDDGWMIACDSCNVWQHIDCMQLDQEAIPENYYCEVCRGRDVDRVRARSLQLRKLEAMMEGDTPPPRQSKTQRGGGHQRGGGRGRGRPTIEKQQRRIPNGHGPPPSPTKPAPVKSAPPPPKKGPANHYSQELRARVGRITPDANAVEPMEPMQGTWRLEQGKLTAGRRLEQGDCILEVIGRFKLKGEPTERGGPTPTVLLHHGLTPSLHIAIECSADHEGRHLSKSCQHNVKLEHRILKGTVHLYAVAEGVIEEGATLSVRHDEDEECSCTIKEALATPPGNKRGRRQSSLQSTSSVEEPPLLNGELKKKPPAPQPRRKSRLSSSEKPASSPIEEKSNEKLSREDRKLAQYLKLISQMEEKEKRRGSDHPGAGKGGGRRKSESGVEKSPVKRKGKQQQREESRSPPVTTVAPSTRSPPLQLTSTPTPGSSKPSSESDEDQHPRPRILEPRSSTPHFDWKKRLMKAAAEEEEQEAATSVAGTASASVCTVAPLAVSTTASASVAVVTTPAIATVVDTPISSHPVTSNHAPQEVEPLPSPPTAIVQQQQQPPSEYVTPLKKRRLARVSSEGEEHPLLVNGVSTPSPPLPLPPPTVEEKVPEEPSPLLERRTEEEDEEKRENGPAMPVTTAMSAAGQQQPPVKRVSLEAYRSRLTSTPPTSSTPSKRPPDPPPTNYPRFNSQPTEAEQKRESGQGRPRMLTPKELGQAVPMGTNAAPPTTQLYNGTPPGNTPTPSPISTYNSTSSSNHHPFTTTPVHLSYTSRRIPTAAERKRMPPAPLEPVQHIRIGGLITPSLIPPPPTMARK